MAAKLYTFGDDSKRDIIKNGDLWEQRSTKDQAVDWGY